MVGLDDREQHEHQHDDQVEDRHFVLEEHAHGGTPVGIVGVACAFGFTLVHDGQAEQVFVQTRDLFLAEVVVHQVAGEDAVLLEEFLLRGYQFAGDPFFR